MIKAILFDLDNTLIDFVKMKTQSLESAAEAMIKAGLKMSKEEILKDMYIIYDKKGIEFQEIFQEFLKSKGEINYKILAEAISAYRKVKYLTLTPYPNTLSTLIKLKVKGLKLGIVSDAPKLQAWIRLADLKLTDVFDFVITAEDVGEMKPHEVPYRKALEILDLGAEEVLFVGDNPSRDILGAKNVGMKTCFAKYGLSEGLVSGHTDTSINVSADYEINDIVELLGIFS